MKFYDNDINFLVADAIVNCRELNFEGVCSLSCRTNPSSIDANGVIIPPKTIVEVLRAPRNPKNSIIELISAAYNVSVTNSYEIYRQWLENIKESSPVAGSACYVISGVGVISISLDGTISFKVERKLISELNFLHETLETAQIKSVATETTKEEKVGEQQQDIVVDSFVSNQIVEDSPVVLIVENEKIDEVENLDNKESENEDIASDSTEQVVEKTEDSVVESEMPNVEGAQESAAYHTQQIQSDEPKKSDSDDTKDFYPKGIIQFWRRLSIMFASLFLLALSLVVVFVFRRPDKAIIKEVKIDRVVYEREKIVDTIALVNNQVEKIQPDSLAAIRIESLTQGDSTISSGMTNQNTESIAGNFWVVGGVLKSITNSERMMKDYVEAGFTSQMRFVESRGSYFVTVGEFDTAQKAQDFLNSNSPIYDDIDLMFWIFENKEEL
ncbi:MAG: hypothetical protein R3Y50_04095 [Rikenellaceae bacterium]